MILGYTAVIAGFLGFLWLVTGVRKISAVSCGTLIGKQQQNEALLLIDLQTVFWDHGPYSEPARQSAKAAILRAVETAKAQGHPVIAVRLEWSIPSTKAVARLAMKGQALAGSAGTEIAQPFAGLADEVLTKRVQDAFETGELDALLTKRGVGKLRIVGLDLNYCVLKTALAARNRGYETVVVKDATLYAAPIDRAEKQMNETGVVLA